MILHFSIQKLVWVFNWRFSTTFVLRDLLGKNECTVREALPWVFKPFSFSIWYSTIFTPLIILSIVHLRLFNKFNCNRDPRTFSRHALRVAYLIHPIYLQWIPWLFGHLFLWTWSRRKLVKELSEVQKCIWPDTCKQLLIYSVHNLTVAFTFVLIVIWTDRTDRLFFTSWKISWAIISW